MTPLRSARQTDSRGVQLVEFSGGETGPDLPPREITAQEVLFRMRDRLARYGSPLPDGFVPPPGIDIAALLQQLPWPPPSPDA